MQNHNGGFFGRVKSVGYYQTVATLKHGISPMCFSFPYIPNKKLFINHDFYSDMRLVSVVDHDDRIIFYGQFQKHDIDSIFQLSIISENLSDFITGLEILSCQSKSLKTP